MAAEPKASVAARPRVSVLIPFKNEENTLHLILDSLLHQEDDVPFEVLFADGCSTDRSVEVIRAHPLCQKVPVIIVSLPPENHGMTVGWNMAAKQARGEFLIFSQADIRIRDPKAVAKVAEVLARPGVVGATYISLQADAEFDKYDFWGQVFQVRNYGERILNVYDEKFNGARRDVFEKMNGFDDKRFALGGESIDFLARLKEHGEVVQADVETEHIHGLGKKFTPIGMLKKYCRNSEVMGVTVPTYWQHRHLEPGCVTRLLQYFVICGVCIASLLPFLFPWPWYLPVLLLTGLGLWWNRQAFLRIRNWRLIWLPLYGLAALYCFTWFFLQGLILGRTRFQFDNTMK